MQDGQESSAGIKEFLDRLIADASGKSHTTLEKYIELERALLEQYQRFVAEQLAVNDDALQNFTKLMMTSWMQVVAFQRENRSRFLELQSTIADAHLRFLERMSESASAARAANEPAADAE